MEPPSSPSANSEPGVQLISSQSGGSADNSAAPPPPPADDAAQSAPPTPTTTATTTAAASAAPAAVAAPQLRSRGVDSSGRIRIGGQQSSQPPGEPTKTGVQVSFVDFATGRLAEKNTSANRADDEWWEKDEVGRERMASTTHGRVAVSRLGTEATAASNRFCWRYFFQQLITHLTLPFSLPFFIAIEGKIRAQNQALWPSPEANLTQGIRSFFGQNLFPLTFWFLIVIRVGWAPAGVSDVEFFIAIFGYIAHRLVLATKYALLSDDYTRALGRRLISANVHRNIELVTGWATPSIEVCDRELRSAGRKLGIHLERVAVVLNKGDLDVATPDVPVAGGAGPDTKDGGGSGHRGSAHARHTSMAAAEQCADPLFGVGLTSADDKKYDPVVAPEPGPSRTGSMAAGPGGAPTTATGATAAAFSGVVVEPVKPAAAAVSPSASAASAAGRPPLPSKNDSKSSLFTKQDSVSQDLLTFYAGRGEQTSTAVEHKDDLNQVRLSGLFLATRVVRELCVNSPAARVKYWQALLIASVQALLPILVRIGITGGDVFGSGSWSAVVLTIFCFLMTFAFTTILVLFILVGVADYYRRFALMKVLGVMIDPTSSAASTSDDTSDIEAAFRPLFIDLALPSNIPAWFAIRQVIHEFGVNFRMRIQLYTSYSLVLAFGLFIVVLYNLARGEEPDYVFIASVSFNSIVIFLLLASMVYYGGRANEQYDVHQSILVRIQFAIREALAETMPFTFKANNFNVEYETLKQCESLIESVLKCLVMGNSTNPVTILGVRASDQVFTALGGFAATAFGTAARVLTTGTTD